MLIMIRARRSLPKVHAETACWCSIQSLRSVGLNQDCSEGGETGLPKDGDDDDDDGDGDDMFSASKVHAEAGCSCSRQVAEVKQPDPRLQ